jgi:hypothetical protein
MEARHAAAESHRLIEGAQVARRPRSSLRRRATLALATAALATLALAAPALAATTIGQTGGDPNTTCFGPFLRADTNYVVPPGGGTITSFSFQTGPFNAGQQLDFLVLRPTTGSNYTVVGKTGLVALGTGGVETFAANISVQGGDILGFWHPGVLDGCVRLVAGGGEINSDIFGNPPDPSVGDTVSLPSGGPTFDLNESANLVTGPTSKNQCKRGGWQSFGDTFKNQGQCVRLFGT